MVIATGHVSERPFARTIYAISARRLTGDLILSEAGRRYAIGWEDGQVVAAESAAPTDTVGRIALTTGLVTSSVVARSMQLMTQSPGTDQLELLIELARLSPDHVSTLRRRVLAHRAARVFALGDARFELTDQREIPRDPVSPLDARLLIYSGLRSHYSEERLIRELSSVATRAIRLAGDAMGAVACFGFGDVERPVVDMLHQRSLGLDELRAALPGTEGRAVLAVVYALVATDCLEIGDTVTASTSSESPGVTEPSRPDLGGRKNARPGATTPPLTYAAVGSQNRMRRLTGQAPLTGESTRPRSSIAPPSRPPGTIDPPSRPPGAVNPASRPPGTISPPTSPPTTNPPSRPPAPVASAPASGNAAQNPPTRPPERPLAAGTRATGVPLTAAAIAASRGTSSTPPPAGDAAANEARQLIRDKLRELEGHTSHFALLGLASSASADQIRAGYFQLAKRLHPDRLRALGVNDLAADAQRLFAAINQAFTTLSDPGKRKQYEALQAAGGAEAVRQAEAKVEELTTKVFRAEDAFRKGEMAMRRNQFDQARVLFAEAVELSPDEAEHQALLAWATWITADNKPAIYTEVQRRLNQAIQVSARCIPAHFYRAMIAKQAGKEDVAIEGFRRVLELNSSHAEADLELRLLETRRGKTKKK